MKRILLTAIVSILILQGINGQFLTSSQTIGSGANQLDISVSVDAGLSQAKFEITGPATVWFGFSFNTTSMSPGSYTILANVSGGNPAEYIMVNHAAPTLQPVQNLTSITSSTSGGRKTYVFYRAISTGDANDYTFQTTAGNLNIAWAYGTGLALGYHGDRGSSNLNFINPCGTVPSTTLTPINICQGDSVMIFGQYQSTPGNYSFTYPVIWGCDSVVIQPLVVNNAISNTLPTLHICTGDSIMIFGQYQHLPGNYSITLQSAVFCDSIVIQPLSISSGSIFLDTSYFNLCQGDSLSIGNQWIKTPGFYTEFKQVAGCDSVFDVFAVTITLIDTTITVIGSSLNAVPGYDMYQWINCANGQPALGSINSNVFTPMILGSYRVEITSDSCIASSGCVVAGPTSVDKKQSAETKFEMYPNPATTYVNIEFSELINAGTVSLIDLTGRIILSEDIFQATSTILKTDNVAPGRYQMIFKDKNGISSRGIIIRN